MIYKHDAIKALEEFADSMTTIGGSYIRTAIKQAIIPLPDHGGGVAAEYTISRELALEICDWYEHECTGEDMYIKSIAEDLKNLPAAEPQWIPCNKQMPKKGLEVWVTVAGYDVIIPKAGETIEEAVDRISKTRWVTQGFLGSDGWYGADGYPMTVMPIAWKPLEKPRAYEGTE